MTLSIYTYKENDNDVLIINQRVETSNDVYAENIVIWIDIIYRYKKFPQRFS